MLEGVDLLNRKLSDCGSTGWYRGYREDPLLPLLTKSDHSHLSFDSLI